MRKLLALLMMALFFVPAASAADYPYAEETILSTLILTPTQRTLADFLYQPIFRCEEEITLPKGTRYDDVSAAMGCLMQDYPELFHLGKNYTVGYYADEPEYATWVKPSYRMDKQEAAALRAELYAQAYLMASSAGSALEIHDQLCASVTYGGDPELRHTAVGAILQGKATCEGYAQALTLLLRMKNIPCGVISGMGTDSAGSTEPHSWNIARLNGYTLIDATWNDQDHLGMTTHWYYGLSAAQMGADHRPDAEHAVPACGAQDNWHIQQGCVISSQAGADAAIRRLVQGETVNLRITDAALYDALAHNTFAWLEGYNQRCPDAPFYGTYSLSFSDAQQCVILRRTEAGNAG